MQMLAITLLILAVLRTGINCAHFIGYIKHDGIVQEFFLHTAYNDTPGDGIDPFSMERSQIRLMEMVAFLYQSLLDSFWLNFTYFHCL
jgi:hypothetical protein